jgi:hypothetical protein
VLALRCRKVDEDRTSYASWSFANRWVAPSISSGFYHRFNIDARYIHPSHIYLVRVVSQCKFPEAFLERDRLSHHPHNSTASTDLDLVRGRILVHTE